MSQETNPKSVSQIQAIHHKIQQDNAKFSEFELDFIGDQVERIEQYGEDTYFSQKQAALIERIHAERVCGEVVERPKKSRKAA
jgi:hypothetical protein